MEGYWGMGSTVSSYSTAKKMEVGAPGGRSGKKGEDPEAIMRRALADRLEGRAGPAVDGTPYSDPRFAHMLEDYHRAAADAHEGHGHVLLSMPEATAPVPSDQVAARPLEATP